MLEAYQIQHHLIPQDPLIRGQGNVWPISGYISGDLKAIRNVQISINGATHPLLELFRVQHEIDSIDFFKNTLIPNVYHFCHFITSTNHNEDKLNIEIVITTKNDTYILPFCAFSLLDNLSIPPPILNRSKIAICMATYNPNIELLKKQIISIQNQDEQSWQLIINDDRSDPKLFEQIKYFTESDSRIHVFQNQTNLGFYYNFEACLNKVHSQFDFIALADQDDYWNSTKLSALLANIDSNLLIYNDMEIRNAESALISNSFWEHRSNHFTNFSALFLANTVTGSASLFRSSFLKKLLPLPTKIGNSFHDHWMGLAASMGNGLSYLDEVHQTYIQHENNVTGYGHFKTIDMRQSTLSMLSLQRMKMSVALDANHDKNKKFIKNNLKVYFDAYLRRKLQYCILNERFPGGGRKRLDKIFLNQKKSIQQLLLLHFKIYQNDWMTNNAELSYINAIEVMKKVRVTLKAN